MNKNYKQKQRDQEAEEEQAKDQRARDYILNSSILEEWEAANLGGKKLPRHGDSAVYTQFGVGKNPDGTACAIPSGLPIPLSDPMFVAKFKNCPYHKQAFPSWDWDGVKRQDLSNPLATEEQIKEMYDNLKDFLGAKNSPVGEKSKYFDHNKGRLEKVS